MNNEKKMSFPLAISILLACIVILLVGVIILGLDPHIPIIINIALVIFIGKFMGISWDDLVTSIVTTVGENISVVVTIMIVGCVVASFMTCGTVPIIICYGLKIMSPSWFLPCVLILCFIMALLTGSSYTTAATIGVAFMGVGISMGIPSGIVAGTIISGALCGDKHSPLGAATNLAATLTGVSVYDTEKSTRYTTIPTMILSLIACTIIGLQYSGAQANTEQVDSIINGLESHYHLTPLLFIPMIILLIMIFMKIPAIPALITASLIGAVFSIVFQGVDPSTCFAFMENGYVADTGVELVDKLLSRGGLINMGSTLILIILGLSLAGVLIRLSVMESVASKISSLKTNRFLLVTETFFMSFIISAFAGDCHMGIVLSEKSMENQFRKIQIDPAVLSRCVNDGATAMFAVVPWTAAGLYFSGTLGTSVGSFAPYYFLGYGTVIFTLVCALTGIGTPYIKEADYKNCEMKK